MSKSIVSNQELFSWLCPLDRTKRNKLLNFGRQLEEKGFSEKIIAQSYLQICAKTSVCLLRLSNEEVVSLTRRLRTANGGNNEKIKPQGESSRDLVLEEDENSINPNVNRPAFVPGTDKPVGDRMKDKRDYASIVSVPKTDCTKVSKGNTGKEKVAVVKLDKSMESCKSSGIVMEPGDGKPSVSSVSNENTSVKHSGGGEITLPKPKKIHVQETVTYRHDGSKAIINVDEAFKYNKKRVEERGIDISNNVTEISSVEKSKDKSMKSSENDENKVSFSESNLNIKIQSTHSKNSLKAYRISKHAKTVREKNGVNKKHLKIGHESTRMVESNKEKYFGTENVDGKSKIADITLNACAGDNSVNKNTANNLLKSMVGVSQERNVEEANKIIENLKGKMTSEVEVHHKNDLVLIKNDQIKLQITELKDKLAQSLKSKNIDISSSEKSQENNLCSNLNCKTSSIELPKQSSLATVTKTGSKFKTCVEEVLDDIVHKKGNNGTSISGNQLETMKSGEIGQNKEQNAILRNKHCHLDNDDYQKSLSEENRKASIKSTQLTPLRKEECRNVKELPLTGFVTKPSRKESLELAPLQPVSKDGVLDGDEDCNDLTMIDGGSIRSESFQRDTDVDIDKTAARLLQDKKHQNKEMNKQITNNSSLDKPRVKKTTELQEQLREFTSQVKEIDKQLTAKKHTIGHSGGKMDETSRAKRQRISIESSDQRTDRSKSGTVTEVKATMDFKEKDRIIQQVPTQAKSSNVLFSGQRVSPLRPKSKSLDARSVATSSISRALSVSDGDLTRTRDNCVTLPTASEQVSTVELMDIVSDDTNPSPTSAPCVQVSLPAESTEPGKQCHQSLPDKETPVEPFTSQNTLANVILSLTEGFNLQNTNLNQSLPSSSTTERQNIPMNMKGNTMLSKAANIYTFYFGKSFEHIPSEIVKNINYYLQTKRKSLLNISTSYIVHLYLYIYQIKFSDKITLVNKTAELLHLAIADFNRKSERIDRAQRLTSEVLRHEEINRANEDYSEMLKLRGCRFRELFLSMLAQCSDCEHVMLTALYFRVTQALVNIDRENIHYIYTLRKLIKELMKPPVGGLSEALNYFFQLSDSSFGKVYLFAKHCIVSLYAAGYKEVGSDDILRLAQLEPCASTLQNLLVKYNAQQEEKARKINLAQETCQTEATVASDPLIHRGTGLTNESADSYRNMQSLGSMNSTHQLEEAIKNLQNARAYCSYKNQTNTAVRANHTEMVRQVPYKTGSTDNSMFQQQISPQPQISSQNVRSAMAPTQLFVVQPSNVANQPISYQSNLVPRTNQILRHPPPSYQQSINVVQRPQNQQTPFLQQLLNSSTQQNLFTPNRQMMQPQTINNVRPTPTRLASAGNFTYVVPKPPQPPALTQGRPVVGLNRSTPAQTSKQLTTWHLEKQNIINQQQLLASNRKETVSRTLDDMPSQLPDSNGGVSPQCNSPNCGRLATVVCSLCKDRFYCSRDCQIQDWYNQHSRICLGKC
uniref:MYND-type domain-containing protein n=1 Tax=Graphocephala atropunctata TaxID=36148 RepID=A0A1B6KDI2_9HEMI